MTDNEVRVGVVGTGGFANSVHMQGYRQHPGANLVGVCDIDIGRANRAAETFGAGFVTDDYHELVTRDDIDAIDIVTPNVLHTPVALAAFKAGKHVMCEKPLTMNYAEAQQLARAAEEAGTVTGVNFSYRGHPAARYVKYLIEKGNIGRIFHVNAFYMQGWLTYPKSPMVWRLQKEMTGTGVLGDLGAHVIDLVEWMTGEQITEVVADMTTFIKQRPLADGSGMGEVDVDDGATFLARLNGGGMGTFVSSRNATARGNYQRIEIYGDAGSLVYSWDDTDHIEAALGPVFVREGQMLSIPVPARFTPRDGQYGWTENVSNFIDAIIDGKEMEPNFSHGIRNQEVLEAITMSVQDRRWVSLPLDV